jgi:hypothetical protein
VAKDRAAPFSRKHRRAWLLVTGGMILIGIINLTIGFYVYARAPRDAPRVPPPAWQDPEPAAAPAAPAAPVTPR